MELAQDHVAERKGQRRVGALLGVQPVVGQLGQLGIVRADRHRLGAVVARLGEEMRRLLYQSADSGTSVCSPQICGEAGGRSQYQS
ncbi:hypothetical protein G6F45_013964 [Rhizopus arrhizus]|nr:hypothetical protein G6F45_013964 [Rhizopus arrhizus]